VTTTDTEVSKAEVTEEVTGETIAVAETAVETPAAEPVITEAATVPVAETPVTPEAVAPVVAANATAPAATTPATQFEMTPVKNNGTQARQQQLAKENQARIDAYKQEQKQHMTEMFARIKTLESQQLDRYKANQDSQIVRLREQISQQQQMIEALVLRNKELFELRAASMQRGQNNREQVLNRI